MHIQRSAAAAYSDSLSNLPAGTYNVQARYAGDGTFASSLSAPVQVTVAGGEATTISLTPQVINLTACTMTNGNTFTYGQLVWVQATVTGASGQGVPTGTVTITDSINRRSDQQHCNAGARSPGQRVSGGRQRGTASNSCLYDYLFAQSPMLSGGSHSLSATYSGDATFASPGTATPATVTVSQIPTAPTLAAGRPISPRGRTTSSPLPSRRSLRLQRLPTHKHQERSPTGTVTFTDTTTSTVLGTATVTPTVVYTSGSTSTSVYPSWTYAAIATGTVTGITQTGANSITATYSGDSNYIGTTTSAATVTVDSGTGIATTTTVATSANPTTLAGRPTFTATIAATPTAPTSGTVTFYDATYGVVLGTGTVGTAHTASFRLAATPAFVGGNHNIVASYGGFEHANGLHLQHLGGSRPGCDQGKWRDQSLVQGGRESGETYQFSGVFTPSSTSTSYAPVLGVMTFSDAVNGGASTAIATAVPNLVGEAQGGYALWTASGSATLSTPGTHVITAQYSDVNYLSSVSNSVTVYVGNTANDLGIYLPLPGSTLTSGTAAFRWYPVAGSSYWLDIGSTQGGNNYYSSGNMGSVLSATVSTLPTNGSTVWARLWYYPVVGGNWQHTDSSFTALNAAAAAAMMTSPTNTSTLTGSTVTFNWSAGASATIYWLDIGSSSGGNNYYSSGSLSTAILMETVAGLPTNGSTVYATPVLEDQRQLGAEQLHLHGVQSGGLGSRDVDAESGIEPDQQHGDIHLDGGRGRVGLLAGCGRHAGCEQLLFVGQSGQRANHHGQRAPDRWQHDLRHALLADRRAVVWQHLQLHGAERNRRPGSHADANAEHHHKRDFSNVHLEFRCERHRLLGRYRLIGGRE